MAGPLAFTDEVKLDFGLPWPRYGRRDWTGWSDDEVRAELSRKLVYEQNARVDPIQFGWTLEGWREVMDEWAKYDVHAIFGGNRSSKSVCCSRICVFLLMAVPECRLRCYQVNDEKSITEQQQFVWEALPERYKHLSKRKSETHSIVFSQKNGFTGNKLIIPPLPGYRRGSEMLFGTYQQYRNDPQVVEGWWAHGVWCDEEVPVKMYERLLTRLFDAHGRMLLSFTTVQGWSPLVADILGKTKTLKKRHSNLLNREIPVAQESLSRRGTRVYYFWTEDNPFIPDDVTEKMRGRPKDEILAIMHGIPTRSMASPFRKFEEPVHVIAHEKLPWLAKRPESGEPPDYTTYHSIDPAGSKPWFMLWGRVDAAGNLFIHREWPDEAVGMWAEPGDQSESKPGPAQKPLGWSTGDYVAMMRTSEEGEEVFERIIDPRLSVAETPTREGATSILSELEAALDEAKDACPRVVCSPGLPIEHGNQLINDRLAYDETKPISALNAPKLYISDRCQNLIWAFKNHTGRGGKDEATKDPLDCLRYLLETGADYVARTGAAPRNTFSY